MSDLTRASELMFGWEAQAGTWEEAVLSWQEQVRAAFARSDHAEARRTPVEPSHPSPIRQILPVRRTT